eukprot:240109-Hanusia_phi.AAC.1
MGHATKPLSRMMTDWKPPAPGGDSHGAAASVKSAVRVTGSVGGPGVPPPPLCVSECRAGPQTVEVVNWSHAP